MQNANHINAVLMSCKKRQVLETQDHYPPEGQRSYQERAAKTLGYEIMLKPQKLLNFFNKIWRITQLAVIQNYISLIY